MPGIRTTIIDKNSGAVDFAYLPPPCSPDEIPKLTEWFTCYRNGVAVERFVSAKRAQDYCDRGLADNWKKETIKS
jgi:hypothetical protein